MVRERSCQVWRRSRHRQQIEVFEALGQPGANAAAFPSGLWWLTRFTVGPLMLLVEDEPLQLSCKGRYREDRMIRG
jgi:hypothetical protein